MVRYKQRLLGKFVMETIDRREQEVRVSGEGARVMFDQPYNRVANPENSRHI